MRGFDDFDKEFKRTEKTVKRSMLAIFLFKIVLWVAVIAGCIWFVNTCNSKGGLVPFGKEVLGIEQTK